MEIVSRRAKRAKLCEIPWAAFSGGPVLLRRCDAFGCNAPATQHCSGHGVHFCRAHFEEHREEWHSSAAWEMPLAVGRC